MSRRVRYALALVALAALGAALVAAVVDLEPFGHYPGPYGDVLAKVVPGERHTDSSWPPSPSTTAASTRWAKS